MADILFIPMNTNHVIIFESVIEKLTTDYDILCHDNLCHGKQYHTEEILKERKRHYLHFDKRCTLPYNAELFSRIFSCLKMKRIIEKTLKKIKPSAILLGVDNDPMALLIIRFAKKNNINTFLLQDGLIRPQEYMKPFSVYPDSIYSFLRAIGIPVKSSVYGIGRCTKTLVYGRIARDILIKRGTENKSLILVGQPKYDFFMEKFKKDKIEDTKDKRLLFAATKELIKDNENIAFLKELVSQCFQEEIQLVVKMHPRSVETPIDVQKVLSGIDLSNTDIIKGGDDTVEILKTCKGVITLYSTVIIEALMMDKEGIAVHYLSGAQNLCHYDEFNAIHTINSINQVNDAVHDAIRFKKPYENKKRLLESELYKLDGKASSRVAEIIESTESL